MAITYSKINLEAKALKYCETFGCTISHEIGFGTQGIVFRTSRNTAIKVYDLKQGYQRERDIYERLRSRKIDSIRGMRVPRILNWDDSLNVFEMSVVHVPCIINFGGAYLDFAPDHMVRDEIWLEQKSEEFGPNWQEVQAVIREIEHRASI